MIKISAAVVMISSQKCILFIVSFNVYALKTRTQELALKKLAGNFQLRNSNEMKNHLNITFADNHTVLIIDDEQLSCHIAKTHLSPTYKVITSYNGEDGLTKANREKPDVILLDLGLPGLDGFEICRMLRNQKDTREIPIIIFSGAADSEARTKAFAGGADDFITKPVVGSELVARVQSKVRRLQESRLPDHVIQCGNLTVDVPKHLVSVDEIPVELSLVEFNLLKFLVKNQERVLSRSQILENVWRDCIVSSRTIDTHILALRRKLHGWDYELTSVYGVGYGTKFKARGAIHLLGQA